MHIAIDLYQQALVAQLKVESAAETSRHLWESYPTNDKGKTKAFKLFEHLIEQACSLSTKTNLARCEMIKAIDAETKENNRGSY